MQGFKSFAEKTVIEFGDGITAVVGPNGSGKSNISDAVRWVLGEQRARSLRALSMEDVSFSGTETRKPVNFAEVSIIIDNTDGSLNVDYENVKITRRLFRSGKSEYLINDKIARLSDINLLLADTGIGKEGYSIIGQGKVDAILLTGGLVRFQDIVDGIKTRCGLIAPVSVYPGEMEQEAMALPTLKALRGELVPHTYTGKNVWNGFEGMD